MFNQITIIGGGLIGSSLARVIKKKQIAKNLVIADKSESVCSKIASLSLADRVYNELSESVKNSDLVILAAPVGAFESIAKEIGPFLKAGAIVTDVGSVKKAVIDMVQPYLPESVHLLPAHPIAGAENSGPEFGLADLFEERWCIITPPPECDLRIIEHITLFWEACGARIEVMDAEHHDLVLGITSHLPHLLAYTIVGTAADLEDDIKAEVIKYSAGGFRGFTRIAASDPIMWRDVFLNNKDAVLEILQRYTEDLAALQKAIRRGDGAYMEKIFSRGQEIRRNIVKLGPEGIPSPAQKDTL
jgi:cyclohexadieny/prephenate dehydrogenase